MAGPQNPKDQKDLTALDAMRYRNQAFAARQKKQSSGKRLPGNAWKRVTYKLPREEARQAARDFFLKYPKAAYWSEVESWRVLPDDVIEFTLRRLPTAD